MTTWISLACKLCNHHIRFWEYHHHSEEARFFFAPILSFMTRILMSSTVFSPVYFLPTVLQFPDWDNMIYRRSNLYFAGGSNRGKTTKTEGEWKVKYELERVWKSKFYPHICSAGKIRLKFKLELFGNFKAKSYKSLSIPLFYIHQIGVLHTKKSTMAIARCQ